MSLLSISPTLGSRRSMAPDGFFRRSPPTKPFLLRGDRMRCVTIAAAPQKVEIFNKVSNDPLTLYDMRKLTSQNVVRRRIVSMGEHLSPRGSHVAFDDEYEQAAVRRASQMVLDALYDSSPDSSPPCTPNDVYGKKQDAWQFPLPPASMSNTASKSQEPPALNLCHDILPGLGFEGLENFTFAESTVEVGCPVSPPAQNTPQSFNGQYDSDTAPSSHWSPSTCAGSVCESQGEADEELSFTEPLAIRKPGGRQSVMADNGEGLRQYEEEQDDYLRPFPATAEGDDAKLERLRSSYSLLGMMSEAYTEQEQEVEQTEQGDEEERSPAQEINLRLLLSPEHAAPSLAEQLAFACGNGYQYHDRLHRDSAGEYLMTQSLSPLMMTPAQLGSLDPFNGLQAEFGDSWSEVDHESRTPAADAAGNLSRGPSTRSAHHRMSVISNTSPIMSGHMAAMAFMHRSKSHVGHFEPSAASSLTVPKKQDINGSLLLSPLSLQCGKPLALSFANSPAPQNLEEFSYLTLMDHAQEVESPLQMEMSQSPLETPQALDEASATATAEVASLRAKTTRLSSTASMGDILSPAFSDFSSAFPVSVTCSKMTRSSTSTSILDRGRPVRPSSGTGFLGQREEKIQIIKLKTGLSSAAAAKLADGPPARPPRPARAASGNHSAVGACAAQAQATSAAESVKREWVEKNSTSASTGVPCKAHTAVAMAKQDSRTPSVHFHIPSSSSIQIAKHVRVVSSSTSRGVPMTMTRSTSRPGTYDFHPTDPTNAQPAGVKRLSSQAAAALKEAKLEAEQAAAAAAQQMKVAPRPAMPGGTQSAEEVRRSGKESKNQSSSEASKPFQAPPMPERSTSAPPPPSTDAPRAVAPTPARPARPLKAADRPGRGLPTSYSLPTLFTARTVSQRYRGETGLPETQATLAAAAGAAARANRKSSSPLGRLLTESGVKVAAAGAGAGIRPRRWGMVKALSPEERRNSAVALDTPGGCVLILEEETVVKEVAAAA
ncbi:hypothetical protein BCV69DRAFT_285527 [Microstroma glucosiphilum]|uniref:Uncharacterized protein n=1 Tax=Pseudomicrostroma glucosiphilum TaxID=1684307 RepID=A0A316TWT3_9BASI|nr:hypothetical protein BCV69DRAFT_285527 [Pseudomicrostroma glucosiphilum]PWN17936.1 hypothetical protein BCV69DRAFT_285527 [Pseudomicrostroma glucosiphilum]